MISSSSSQTTETGIQQIIENSPGNSPGTGMTNIVQNTSSEIDLTSVNQVFEGLFSEENFKAQIPDTHYINGSADHESTGFDVPKHTEDWLKQKEEEEKKD